MANYNTERYLGNYINVFRNLFNDNSLSISDLNAVFEYFHIPRNPNGTYNITLINDLIGGNRVSFNQVNIHDLKQFYYDEYKPKMYGIQSTQSTPTPKHVTVPSKRRSDYCYDNEGVYWEDGGSSMEDADFALQQKYLESIKPKTIIISESQYRKLIKIK